MEFTSIFKNKHILCFWYASDSKQIQSYFWNRSTVVKQIGLSSMYILMVALKNRFVFYNLKIPSSFPFLCYFDGKKEATELPELLLENTEVD